VIRRPYAYNITVSQYMEDAMRRRGQLVPLLFTALADFTTTGISPLHPLYYDWPEVEEAYAVCYGHSVL